MMKFWGFKYYEKENCPKMGIVKATDYRDAIDKAKAKHKGVKVRGFVPLPR